MHGLFSCLLLHDLSLFSLTFVTLKLFNNTEPIYENDRLHLTLSSATTSPGHALSTTLTLKQPILVLNDTHPYFMRRDPIDVRHPRPMGSIA